MLDDSDAAVRLVEFDGAVFEREERPVTTDADILARVGLAAALTDDDTAGPNDFATKKLHAETLSFAGTAVGCGTLTCFMRLGGWFPLEFDGFDLNDGKLLAVAALFLVALALLFLEDDDLVAALVLEDFGRNLGTREQGRADAETRAFAGGEHIGDLDRRAFLGAGIEVDGQDVALGDGELLALRADGGFHK